MTIAEIRRAIESKKRIQKLEAQERASYDYILGDLIGRSVARIYSNSAKYPEIHEMYPAIFDVEEIEESKRQNRMKLSAERMKQFAQSYNKRFKNKGAKKDNE